MTDLLLDELEATPALLKRQLRPDDIHCPAGRVVGDAGCYCAIEEGVIDGRTQTMSISAFCMSEEGYKECPTWRAEKDRIEAGDPRKLTEPIKVNKGTAQQRRDRLAMAQERLYDDSNAGRRFRRRIGLPESVEQVQNHMRERAAKITGQPL